jgi:group I intron endonuclease
MAATRCGIYEIKCLVSGKFYIGSSKSIHVRWSAHRRHLRKGTHHAPRLQRAWNKHGEERFVFLVLEECASTELLKREQYYLDFKKPDYNSNPHVIENGFGWTTNEMRAKRVAALRLRASAVTHCPRGHEYSEQNTYVGKSGWRVCKACNALRAAKIRASLTPEQRAYQRQQFHEIYMRNHEKNKARLRAAHWKNRESNLIKMRARYWSRKRMEAP